MVPRSTQSSSPSAVSIASVITVIRSREPRSASSVSTAGCFRPDRRRLRSSAMVRFSTKRNSLQALTNERGVWSRPMPITMRPDSRMRRARRV